MRKILLSSVVFTLAAASAAVASDDPGAMAEGYDWSGLYAGVLAGYGFGDTEAEGNPGFDGSAPGGRAELNPDGFLVGGVIGMNWQNGPFVYGAEGELGYIDAEDSVFEPGGADYFATTEIGELYGTLAARFGYAVDRTLFAVRAGGIVTEVAYGYGDTDSDLPDPFASVFGEDVRFGYMAGASVEHALEGDWILRIDYFYASTSESDTDEDGDDYDITDAVHAVRGGVVKKF